MKILKLVLERYKFAEKSTLGRLVIGDLFRCFTLEDRVREIEGEPVESWKIPKVTAIPRGTYKIEFFQSPHFGRLVPHLIGVPGYTYVLIHWGNKDVDTDGCILVGGAPLSEDFIPNSKATFEALFDILKAQVDAGYELWIEVK